MFENDQKTQQTLDKNLQGLTAALDLDRRRVKGKKSVDSNSQTRFNEEFSPPLGDASSQIQLLKGQDDDDFTKEVSEKQPELINSIDTTRPLKIGTMKLSNKKSKRKSQIQMQKSQSGFDIEQNKAIGSFFSTIRQKYQGEKPNFYDTETMRGHEFVKKLIEQ